MARTSNGRNVTLIEAQKWGFWVGTKQAPRRAVRWEETQHEDGRTTLRGRNWVEVLADGHGGDTPERFFGADVEMVGPHEWLTYRPTTDEPVCGWGRPRLPDGVMQYCPRTRRVAHGQTEAFCPAHMRELSAPEGEEAHAGQEPGPGGE